MKPVLLLLPGMLCDERLFAHQISTFQNSHHIIVGDLTGADSIADLAGKMLTTLPKGPFDLLGFSMGGIVAMEMIGLAPERIRRVALLDTNHLAEDVERQRNRDRQISDVCAGKLEQVVIDEMKPNYLAACNRNDKSLLDLLITMAIDLGKDVFVSQSKALRNRVNQTENLERFQGPMLVLCGEEDVLCSPDRHQEIAQLNGKSELVIVPSAGHVTTLESPIAVNGALSDWLARDI